MTSKAVLFDLGNTLVHYYRGSEFRPILRECLERVAQPLGATVSNELFEQALVLNREDPTFAVRPLSCRMRSLFPGIQEADAAQICRAFMGPIFECARRDPAALEVLDELRRRGIKTAIVSNTPWGSSAELWVAELQRHELLDRVDSVVFCVDAGWRKPHPAPFELALSRLRVQSDAAVFVGDDPRWDVEGALGAGLKPVLLDPEQAPRSDCVVIPDLQALLALLNEAG